MALTPRHTFQVLTKRPKRLAVMLSDPGFAAEVAQHATDLIASRAWQRWQLDLGGQRLAGDSRRGSSAALWLRGEIITVADADAVIEPGEHNIYRLRDALVGMAIGPVPSVSSLRGRSVVPVMTAYGKLDCLLERGRQDWGRLRRRAGFLPVTGVPVCDERPHDPGGGRSPAGDAWRAVRDANSEPSQVTARSVPTGPFPAPSRMLTMKA